MKVKLNLAERFEALKLLPAQGNFATLKIVGDLRTSLAPSEEEFELFELKQVGDQIIWDAKAGAVEVEISMGNKAADLIKDGLKKLDEQELLGAQHITLYEKFVE